MKILNSKIIKWAITFIIVYGIIQYSDHYFPKAKKRKNLLKEQKMLKDSIRSLTSEDHQVLQKTKEIHNLKIELKDTEKQFASLGSQIPSKDELDQFLYYLTYEKHSKGITFSSIKLHKEKTNSKESKILPGCSSSLYKLSIKGKYEDIVNYFSYLDNLSRYVGIKSFTIENDEKNQMDVLTSKLIFSIMLCDENIQTSRKTFSPDIKTIDKKLTSPFIKMSKEVKTSTNKQGSQLPNYTISGVLSNGNNYRVIINTKIYKENDLINKSKILKIQKDKIVLETDGIKHEILVKAGVNHDKK